MSKKRKVEAPPKIHFRETPEWQEDVRRVLKLKERGFDPEQSAEIVQIAPMRVRRILEEEEINCAIIKKQWDEKVPLMRDIIGMGLNGIKETLKEMVDPGVRKQMIRHVADLKALTGIVESLNLLLRLEEGKSTQNVAVNRSYQDTRVVLQDLAKVDPVFSYPQIGDGSDET
jgi:hypothetical protein